MNDRVNRARIEALETALEAANHLADRLNQQLDSHAGTLKALEFELARANAAEARVAELEAWRAEAEAKLVDLGSCLGHAESQNQALRQIISRCAEALGNGAAISPDASVEFMALLPDEITLFVDRWRRTEAE